MNILEKFNRIWHGGYFEGDPLDSMAVSGYGIYGYNSILYTVYLTCIRNYVNAETTALEIGPGRGAWTKAILNRGCKIVYAVDSAPAEHTRFWEYVGVTDRARYLECTDLTLAEVPDNSVDYFFSFGVFCHLEPEMCESYLASLARKMRPGSHGFLMIADYDKYTYCLDHADQLSIKRLLGSRRVLLPARLGYWLSSTFFPSRVEPWRISRANSVEQSRDLNALGWYHWGVDRACEAICREGFQVVERDTEVVSRDPVIHFVRPN